MNHLMRGDYNKYIRILAPDALIEEAIEITLSFDYTADKDTDTVQTIIKSYSGDNKLKDSEVILLRNHCLAHRKEKYHGGGFNRR